MIRGAAIHGPGRHAGSRISGHINRAGADLAGPAHHPWAETGAGTSLVPALRLGRPARRIPLVTPGLTFITGVGPT
jgi:hypothetical protein